MAGWDDILKELNETMSQSDYVRRKYLKQLSDYTGRNTIAYYSAFLSNPQADNIDINDLDMTGFMNALKGMECKRGLDLILHTPGGSPAAAEAIISYLRNKFNYDIRVIVPQMAMSAGTMMACAAKEIIMGKQSSLGPIDPQFNGIPAYNIQMEFEEAKIDLAANPQNAQYWAIKLQQYPAAFLKTAIDAIQLSGKLVREWLETGMFKGEQAESMINTIVSRLNEHDDSKTHGRHFNLEFCKSIGLKIIELESDAVLQDDVLSVHHAYMLTLGGSNATKIIECQNGKAVISHA
ncbi:serine protease [Faecalicatena contorta]|uniref:Serine dehydrogenase proteinase n=1 Tax=Faecalicatena contorta TaxID=39482 RepID=A0A174LFU6_9FIRM|nr:serine protease [Faecalicatena contorta]MRM91377.1 serine protease [Faecalicatena contorta]CUP20470.1 Serine dehydrogenase proteinase [[Eubacterium] contortum] [Faecalicatena contorta]